MSDRSTRYAVSTWQNHALTDLSRRIYASTPFRFIVEGKSLYIHADLVSLHSKPLDRMINGNMAEAQEGLATLEDVGVDTFVRFIEWAYEGYYTAAEFTTVADESPPPPRSQSRDDAVATVQEQQSDVEATPALLAGGIEPEQERRILPPPEHSPWHQSMPSAKKSKRSRRALVKEEFISREYTVRPVILQAPPPRPNDNPQEDYTNVFLSHARLYVFADKYDIEPLKVLALEELHATLAAHTLYEAHTGDVITLLRYVYDNTAESTEGVEDMRTLMTQYVGYEMDILIKDEDFKDLMVEDGGSLLGNFMTMVGKRISKAM